MLIVLLSLFYILLYYYGIFTIGTRLSTNNLLIGWTKNVINCWVLWLTTANPLSKLSRKSKNPSTYSKNLKDVSLALENEDTAKATSLLEIYKTDNASIGNPETQEHLDRLSNPIIASFLSNRILEMRASHVDISINISPQFGEIPLPDLDLYQLLQLRIKRYLNYFVLISRSTVVTSN